MTNPNSDSFQTLDTNRLGSVMGGESALSVFKALPGALSAPLDQTYGSTKDFIKNHAYFHEGLMNLPIGGGKHFRNVPFIGPGRALLGGLSGNSSEVAKGLEATRGTWDAE